MTNVDVDNSARLVLEELESGLAAASAQVRADLERARAMVRDATARLDRSFRLLHASVQSHRDALSTVVATLYNNADGRNLAASSEAVLRQFVEEVVRVGHGSMRIIEELTQLRERVGTISGCADSIDGLARETRFVAFNARIETHRAGEAGRTFKVVADEVKRLANASSGLSNQIRQAVSDCHAQLESVTSTSTGLASHDMSRAIDSHRLLTETVSKLDGINTGLNSMLAEIDASVSEANRAFQFEDMVTQILNATVERVQRMSELSIRALRTLERSKNGSRAVALVEIRDGLLALSAGSAVQHPSAEQGPAELF